jgi:hypothetical protein
MGVIFVPGGVRIQILLRLLEQKELHCLSRLKKWIEQGCRGGRKRYNLKEKDCGVTQNKMISADYSNCQLTDTPQPN